MNRLYIYGDSYADPEHRYGAAGEYQWVKELEKKFKVHNFSVKGTSPMYMLDKFKGTIEGSDPAILKQSNCLFLMSHTGRKHWKFLKPYQHYLLPRIISNDCTNLDPQVAREVRKLRMHANFLKQAHKMDGDTDELKILAIFSTVQTLSKFFNKTIFWPIFQPLPEYTNMYNNKQFQVVAKCLVDISVEENKDDKLKNNHIDVVNHQVMLGQIERWMNKHHNINTDMFRKNVL
jgi:hypothetical protein